MRAHRSSPRGFSAIELMTVVLIMGALAALGWSSLGPQRSRQKLNGFATDLRATLHSARQTALATGDTVVVMVFPEYRPVFGAVGRIIVYRDGDGTFFSGAAAVNFDNYDPASQRAAARSEVVEVVDLPSQIAVGPTTGQGPAAALVRPFDGIRIDVDCEFCKGTGAARRGAIAFSPDGSASFYGGNAAVALPFGASLSVASYVDGAPIPLAANKVVQVQTVAISAPTGALEAVHWDPSH